MWEGLALLKFLLLNQNQISDIEPGSFADLRKLEYLRLTGNRLTAVSSDLWEGLVSLTDLEIDDNQISSISDGSFSGMKNLGELELSGNELTEVTGDMFKV